MIPGSGSDTETGLITTTMSPTSQDTSTAPPSPRCQDTTQSSNQDVFVTDKLGRQHFKISYTGPAAVFFRVAKFQSSTIQSHIHNLKPMIEAAVHNGKSVVINIVDGEVQLPLLMHCFTCTSGGTVTWTF